MSSFRFRDRTQLLNMRIVVAMSGGVDSSVAAALLAEQGHDVIGLSMQLYDQTRGDRTRSAAAARSTTCTTRGASPRRIDIPHYILNFERQFEEQVVSNFVREYAAGRTPLPCAHCNSDLKFATLARARARLRRRARRHRPLRARRARRARPAGTCSSAASIPAKDQSYFLFSLTQEQLARAVFPVGDSAEGRRSASYARERGLPVADKPDSQEICFVPDHDYAAFVDARSARTRRATARSSTRTAASLGRHGGIHRFTVGQRKGLGLVRRPRRADVRRSTLRPPTEQVVVGPKAALERTTLTASGVNWIVGGARRPAARHRADPPSPSAPRPPRVARARRRPRRGRSSTRRRSPSRPARRSSSTTVTRSCRRRLDRLSERLELGVT